MYKINFSVLNILQTVIILVQTNCIDLILMKGKMLITQGYKEVKNPPGVFIYGNWRS